MKVKLGEYIQEYSVRNKANEDIPVYSVTNTQGFCQDYFGKEVASKDKSTYKIVPKGYFAYNPSRINVGSVDWQRDEDQVIVSPLYNVFSVSPELNQQYLYYYLKSDFALHRIKAVATGSVRDNLKLEMLKNFPIRIPSVEEQEYIVQALDKAKNIIDLRRNELQKLDDLIRARFVEMFGDPVYSAIDSKIELSDICEKITDGEHGSVARVANGHPFLNAKHILKTGFIDWKTITYIGDEDHQRIYKRCNPEKGDILLTTTGTIGNVAIMPECEEVSMDRGITLLKINRHKVTSEFVAEMLKHPSIQMAMGANVHASAIGHLFMNKVKKLPAILPSMKKQIEFTTFVQQIDKSKLLSGCRLFHSRAPENRDKPKHVGVPQRKTKVLRGGRRQQ